MKQVDLGFLVDGVGDESFAAAWRNALSVPEADSDGTIKAAALPSELPVSGIAFADGSAVTLSTGTFSGGTIAGQLYVHDGVNPGGCLYMPVTRNQIVANKVFTANFVSRQICNVSIHGVTTSSAGTLTATITAASVSGSPITVTTPATANVTGQALLPALVAAMNATTAFSAKYVARCFGTLIQVQALTVGTDATLQVVLSSNNGIAPITSALTVQLVFLELGRFTLTASEMAQGAEYLLLGKMNILYNYSSGGLPPAYFVLRPSAACQNATSSANTPLSGTAFQLGLTYDSKFNLTWNINNRLLFTNISGNCTQLTAAVADVGTAGGMMMVKEPQSLADANLYTTPTAIRPLVWYDSVITTTSSISTRMPAGVAGEIIVGLVLPIDQAAELSATVDCDLSLLVTSW